MQTYLQLKQRLRAQIWPSGEAKSLRVAHDGFFKAAMMDLQKWVDCLRQNNTSQVAFDDTLWHDAKTAIDAPFGDIRRVYTIANDDWRDPVSYRSSVFDEMTCWSRRLFEATAPTVTVGEEMTLGFRKSDASSDSTVGRARIGIWAVYRRRLYLAPWVQSNETIIVEWDGEKTTWLDTDLVDETYWTPDVEEAIAYYVSFKHDIFYGDKVEGARFKQLYDDKLSDLVWKCREYTRQKPDATCDAGSEGELTGLTQEEIDDDSNDDNEQEQVDEDHVLFVVAGDVGEDSAEALALSAEIEDNDSPEFLVLNGDLNYGSGYAVDLAHYDWAKDLGIVVPVIGNHDWDAGTDIDEYLAFFEDALDGKNNGRYYEHTEGPAHSFILDSDPREPDGISITSIQHEWMYAKAFLSTARWKFVFMHHPPYSSGTTYGSNATLQWDFAAMGIDVVFTSHEHNYEHLLIGGIHYVNIGLGGKSRYPFGSPISGSLTRYNALEARVRVTLDCDSCLIEAVNSAGVVVDSFTITKE